jgi:hypothetical protein
MSAVLEGKPVPQTRPSIGCNIKWIPSQEPEVYYKQQVKK